MSQHPGGMLPITRFHLCCVLINGSGVRGAKLRGHIEQVSRNSLSTGGIGEDEDPSGRGNDASDSENHHNGPERGFHWGCSKTVSRRRDRVLTTRTVM